MIVLYFIVWWGPLWKIELGEPISKTFQPMIFRNWLTPGMVNSIIVAKWILAEPFSIISQPIIFTNWLSSHLGWSTVRNCSLFRSLTPQKRTSNLMEIMKQTIIFSCIASCAFAVIFKEEGSWKFALFCKCVNNLHT